MNLFRLTNALKTVSVTFGLFFATCLGWADPATITAAAKTNPDVKKAASVIAVEPPLPRSVFVSPKKTAEGRDPFFPNSTRPYGVDDSPKTAARTTPDAELALKGISGTPEQPLAIINSTTFTTGEDNEVITRVGRIRIRCVEINVAAGTVLIQMGGERRELRLQSAK